MHLTLVAGHAGCGKTTFARELATHRRAALLDKDTLVGPLTAGLLAAWGCDPADRDSGIYRHRVRPLEYQALFDTAWEMVQATDVVVCAPLVTELGDPLWRHDITARAERWGATVGVIWVRCSPGVQAHRLRDRGDARDAGKLANWDQWAAALIPLPIVADDQVIDNDGALSVLRLAARAAP